MIVYSDEAIAAVRRMQSYIEEHIAEPISLSQLAKAAGYSPWHSDRLFKELLAKTPFEYIRSLRLSKAALKLRDGSPKVIDVAFDFVFDSHEGFTKAFSKQFGLSPKTYSKETPPIRLFIPYPASNYRQILIKGEDTMSKERRLIPVFVQVVERPERKLLIKRGIKASDYFEYCEEVGCDVWGVLASVKEALYEPIGMWLPEKLRNGASEYAQGVELPLDYNKPVPEGFELTTLPPCKVMIFQGPAYKDDDFAEAIGELWDFMDTFDPKLYGYEWDDEAAPRFQLEPMGYRGYIEGRPVKSITVK